MLAEKVIAGKLNLEPCIDCFSEFPQQFSKITMTPHHTPIVSMENQRLKRSDFLPRVRESGSCTAEILTHLIKIRSSSPDHNFKLLSRTETRSGQQGRLVWMDDRYTWSKNPPAKEILVIYLISSSQILNSCEVFRILSPVTVYINNLNLIPFDFIFGCHSFVLSLFRLSLYCVFPKQQNDPFQEHILCDADTSCSMETSRLLPECNWHPGASRLQSTKKQMCLAISLYLSMKKSNKLW